MTPAPHAAKGASSSQVRWLQDDGADYVPLAGWSKGVEVSGTAALLHGTPGDFSYCFFRLATPLVDETDTLTELSVSYSWDAEPSAPSGLYIGLADQANDRWVWLDAATARDMSLPIDSLGIHGVDPATHPNGCYIALVNVSGQEATFKRIALRFKTPDSVAGDEWLYFTQPGSGLPPGVSRISPTSGTVESVIPGTGSGAGAVESGIQQVGLYSSGWKLDFAKSGTFPPQIWRSDLDGSNQAVVHDEAGVGYNYCGHQHGTDRTLFFHSGAVYELMGTDGVSEGRISRASDFVFGGCWDLTVAPGGPDEYGAIATLYDTGTSTGSLVSFRGSPPFPIDATPTAVYTALPTEDAQSPVMLELATLGGDPLYYIYFTAKNRDDATYNIYRVRYPGGSYEPEPVVVDVAYEFRFPAVSSDGKWLAYLRQPAGATWYDQGEIMLDSALAPGSPQQLVPEALYPSSWYEPTP